MPRIEIRCLLFFVACQLLLGPGESLAIDQDWDPFSLAISKGSLVASVAWQLPAAKCDVIIAVAEAAEEGCTPGSVSVRTCKSELKNACDSNPYFPRGRRCAVCQEKKAQGTLDEKAPAGEFMIKDAKNPNAFEFEFGTFELDDTPVPGGKDDIFFIAAGYRRFLLQAGKRDRLRLSAGVGLGVYYLEPGEKLGFNAKVGAEIGLNPKAKETGTTYVTLDLGVVYHRIDSGLDTTGGMAGIRLHFPTKRRSKATPPATP